MGQPNVTCPVCGRWGSRKLGNYCKDHHPNADDDDRSMFEDFPSSFDGEFFPSEYGIIKDKFGYER